MKKIDVSRKQNFLYGFFLAGVLGLTLAITAFSLLLGFSVSYWQFPLATLIGAGIHARLLFRERWFAHSPMTEKVYLYLVPLSAIAVSLIVAGYFYDVSPDGQEYHQEAILQLHNGWNPYFTALPQTANQAIWINHYAKGMEIIQSAIYHATGNIEAGKATNFIALIAGYFLSVSAMLSFGLPLAKSRIIAVLLSLNPVTVNQLLTFYVDGVLASFLVMLICAILFVILERQLPYQLLLVFAIILAINVKFTAIVFVALFTGSAAIWSMWHRRVRPLKQLIATGAAAVILAFIIGFNPYVTNTIRHGNPLYPLLGPDKVDIMTHNLPGTFEGMSKIKRFAVSLFSHTDNAMAVTGGKPDLKIPFTVKKTDINSAGKVDTRIAGFGPLFSGILVLALGLFIALCIRFRAYPAFKHPAFLLLVLAVSVAVIPEAWWARYVPQLWLVPLVMLFALEHLLPHKRKVLKYAMYMLVLVNISFTGTGIIWNILITSHIDYQLAQLKASGEVITVEFRKAQSNRIRFQDHKIPYVEQDLEGDEHAKAIVRSDSRFLPPKSGTDEVKPPLVIRLTERFKMDNEWVGYKL